MASKLGRFVLNTVTRTSKNKNNNINNNKRLLFPVQVVAAVTAVRGLSSPAINDLDSLPESIKRIGAAGSLPNEFPGQIYSFNWCLNGDGVTPLKRSAFRITKGLDLKVAGLDLPQTMSLKVKPAAAGTIPEAGADDEKLSFEQYDEYSQSIRDYLSLSDSLYCPEGHVPGTRTGVRIITNSATLAPSLLAYLDRAPKKEPAESLPITVYALAGEGNRSVAGYAIEEIEVPIMPNDNGDDWHTGDDFQYVTYEAKSVASVIVSSKDGIPDLSTIVAGIELCQKALEQDEISRAKEKEEEEEAKAE